MMSSRSLPGSADSTAASRRRGSGSSSRSSRTAAAGNSSNGNGRGSRNSTMCAKSIPSRPKRRPRFSSVAEILASRGLSLKAPERAAIPTSPDTSSPWPDDSVHDGWSARTFLHRMLAISLPGWKSSDTESLLSSLTPKILRPSIAGGSSLSDVLLPYDPDSSWLYMTPRAIQGMIRRQVRRKHLARSVLLRTPTGLRKATLEFSFRAGVYGVSLRKNTNPSRGSPEALLLEFLEPHVRALSATLCLRP